MIPSESKCCIMSASCVKREFIAKTAALKLWKQSINTALMLAVKLHLCLYVKFYKAMESESTPVYDHFSLNQETHHLTVSDSLSLHLSTLHPNLWITASISRKILEDLISVLHSQHLGASILMDKHLHDMQINNTNEKLHPNIKPGNW